MFKIKQSLDAVNYGAYFYNGEPLINGSDR